MKKIVSGIILFVITLSGKAQNIDMGKKSFYYRNFITAANYFREAIHTNKADAEAYLWLSFCLNEMHQSSEIKKMIDSLPADIGKEPLLQITRGYYNLLSGDSVSARKYFIDAIANNRKKNPQVLTAIAVANIEADKGDNLYAISLIEELLKKDKKNPALYILEGDAYRKLYDGSNAFKTYTTATEIDKNNALAYYKLGKLFQSQNNQELYLTNYTKAIESDSGITPVYYQLFYCFYAKSPNQAKEYLNHFISTADKSVENEYLQVDMQYLIKNYAAAIPLAIHILNQEESNTKPRIYKLLAYCYFEQKNIPDAEKLLDRYFTIDSVASNHSAEDYATMAQIKESLQQPDAAVNWYEKAFNKESDGNKKLVYALRVVNFFKQQKNYLKQSEWLGRVYQLKKTPTNVDLFNWGIATFNARHYQSADSLFALYETKYPEQTFGYYWRARSNAAIDTAMDMGLAVPHYEQLIAVASKDLNNSTNRKWLIQAYSYVAAIKANKDKEYDTSLVYYDKVLQIDPQNADALKYKEILEKMIQNQNHAISNTKTETGSAENEADKNQKKKNVNHNN